MKFKRKTANKGRTDNYDTRSKSALKDDDGKRTRSIVAVSVYCISL